MSPATYRSIIEETTNQNMFERSAFHPSNEQGQRIRSGQDLRQYLEQGSGLYSQQNEAAPYPYIPEDAGRPPAFLPRGQEQQRRHQEQGENGGQGSASKRPLGQPGSQQSQESPPQFGEKGPPGQAERRGPHIWNDELGHFILDDELGMQPAGSQHQNSVQPREMDGSTRYDWQPDTTHHEDNGPRYGYDEGSSAVPGVPRHPRLPPHDQSFSMDISQRWQSGHGYPNQDGTRIQAPIPVPPVSGVEEQKRPVRRDLLLEGQRGGGIFRKQYR